MEDRILSYLVEYHNKKLRTIEKEICPCFHRRDISYIHNHYPPCIVFFDRKSWYGEILDVYWDGVGEYMKEHYSELLMEAYMMVGEYE